MLEVIHLGKDKYKSITHNILKENTCDEKLLYAKFFEISCKFEILPQDFFKAAYKILLNKERGPKLASFILALGKEKAIRLFESV